MNYFKAQYDSTFGEGRFGVLVNSSGHIMVDANSHEVGPLVMRTGTEIRFSCFFDVQRQDDGTLVVTELDPANAWSPYYGHSDLSKLDQTVAVSFRKGIYEAARKVAEQFLTEHPQEWYTSVMRGFDDELGCLALKIKDTEIKLHELKMDRSRNINRRAVVRSRLIELEEATNVPIEG